MKLIFTLFITITSTISYGKDVDVNNLGARGHSIAIHTLHIQKAIDSCAATYGGKVVFTSGVYLSGTLELRSNVWLYLNATVTMMGSTSIRDYTDKSFIIARNCANVGLLGNGTTINSSSAAYTDAAWQPLTRPQTFMLIEHCSIIKIEDIKIINSPSHVVRMLDCQEVNINGIYIYIVERSPNNDGVHIVNSKNVYIINNINSIDNNAICLKKPKCKV